MRPWLGKRLDALEAAWITGSPDERREIEIMVELLRRQASDRWSSLLDPPGGDEADGHIRLGRIRHGRHQLGHLGISMRELCGHCVVLGRTGGGKSNLVHHVLLQLKEQDVPWVATDSKRSTRHLAAEHPEIVVAALGRDFGATLRFNPLQPPPGVDFSAHVRQVVQLICDLYAGGAAVFSVLVQTIESLRDGDRVPTLHEVHRALQNAPAKGRAAPWRQTALRITDRLTSGPLGRVFDTRENGVLDRLLAGHTVLELDGLSRVDGSVVVQLLLGQVHARLLERPTRDRLRLLVCLEEAQDLVPRREGARESIVESVVRTGREAGLGLLLASQQPTTSSQVVLANCFTRVVLNLASRADTMEAAQLLMLDQAGASMLGTLPTGQAVCRLSDRWPHPVHVEIPRVPVDSTFSDRDVLARFLASPLASRSGHSATSTPNTRHHPEPGASPPGPLPRARPTVGGTAVLTRSEEAGDLLDREPLARALLEDVAAHPLDGVAMRYGRLRLSRRKGTAAQRALSSEGWVVPRRVPVPEGVVLLLALTDKARAWCVQQGVSLTPVHGGVEHAYWCERTAARLRDEGWQVATEHVVGSRRVDVWAEKGGKTLAVEVESGARPLVECLARLEAIDAAEKRLLWLGEPRQLAMLSEEQREAVILRGWSW